MSYILDTDSVIKWTTNPEDNNREVGYHMWCWKDCFPRPKIDNFLYLRCAYCQVAANILGHVISSRRCPRICALDTGESAVLMGHLLCVRGYVVAPSTSEFLYGNFSLALVSVVPPSALIAYCCRLQWSHFVCGLFQVIRMWKFLV
jgi:hypothetical protein